MAESLNRRRVMVIIITFVVISQRAKATPEYSLKNLTGHGRFDIVIRCILGAARELVYDQGQLIYAYLKGSTPHGWLAISPKIIDDDDDEISLAAKIRDCWDQYFIEGPLRHLLEQLPRPFALLTEGGERIISEEGTIVLGAQRDLTEEDLDAVTPDIRISLGQRSLLASQAIIYTRQLQLNQS